MDEELLNEMDGILSADDFEDEAKVKNLITIGEIDGEVYIDTSNVVDIFKSIGALEATKQELLAMLEFDELN